MRSSSICSNWILPTDPVRDADNYERWSIRTLKEVKLTFISGFSTIVISGTIGLVQKFQRALDR
jgi:hypothetical protein